MRLYLMKRVAIGILLSVLLWGMSVAGLIIFGTANAPARFAAISDPFSAIEYRALPLPLRYRARDGARLCFREYPGSERQVAVLIHGSAGSSSDMHLMAVALQEKGVTVFVPDLRGHGANQPHGDIAYVGQLDDDLADFMAEKKATSPNAVWTLVGFSSGGGFALRVAAAASLGQVFDRYILLSPYLKYNAPSLRASSSDTKKNKNGSSAATVQSWAAVSTGRIIGLSILNFFGAHAWDGLPVIVFPVSDDVISVTRTYSWRLQRNFAPHENYLADIRAVRRPMHVYVGAADQLFVPEKMRDEFQSQRRDIPVSILANMGHTDMVIRPEAIGAVVAEFQP